MNHDKQRGTYFQTRNIVFIVIVVIVFSFFFFRSHTVAVTYAFSSEPLIMTIGSKVEGTVPVTVSLDEINDIRTSDQIDFGTNISGINTKSCEFGIWKNEEWGTYDLCIFPDVTEYIIITTDSGNTIVCNYDSNDSTKSLYDAIVKYIDELNAG